MLALFAASTLLITTLRLPAPGGEGFTTDFAAATARAAREGKDLLLEFTGSDWCSPCIRLTDEVFSKDAFVAEASKHYVLVVIDNPRGEDVITPEERKESDRLHAQYAINSWPTILLADEGGRPYARTKGFHPGGPEAYLKHLQELQQNKRKRQELFAAAAKSEGVERARLYHQGLMACDDFIPVEPYATIIDAIIESDKDNEAGLRMLWQTRRVGDALENELPVLASQGKWDVLVTKLGGFLTDYEPPTAVRQKALFWRATALARLDRPDEARRDLEAAVALGAEAEYGSRAQQLLARLTGGP